MSSNRKCIRLILLLIAICVISSCGTTTNSHEVDAVSADAIITTHTQQHIDRRELIEQMRAADYIVLGEKHDNPHHHELQAWVLQQLSDARWLQQLSMEMITPAQQKAFLPLQPEIADDDAALQQALAWPEKGWPWQDYRALVKVAVKNRIPLQSANIDREQIMALYQGTQTAPAIALRENARNNLLRDIEESHCGQIKEPQISKMLSIQLARDHAMAQSLLKQPHGVALIAGAFHARKDLGLALHLQQLAPQKKLLTLAFVETNGTLSATEIAELVTQYDVVWVTPVHERDDPCAALQAPAR